MRHTLALSEASRASVSTLAPTSLGVHRPGREAANEYDLLLMFYMRVGDERTHIGHLQIYRLHHHKVVPVNLGVRDALTLRVRRLLVLHIKQISYEAPLSTIP